MKVLAFILLVICSMFYSYTGYSQVTNAYFERITTKDGLSQSTVNYIIQDKKGFMWFATFGGINKYDGYTFKIYRNIANDKTSLSNNGIVYLFEDNEGFIWAVNNAKAGLDKYNPDTESFTRHQHNPKDTTSISSNEVYHVRQDKSGNIWVCTKNALNLVIYKKLGDKTVTQFKRFYNYIDSTSFTMTYEDRNNNLLLFGRYLYYFDRKNNKIRKTNIELNEFKVMSICEDKSGNLWLGTEINGIIKLVYDKKNKSYTKVTLNKVNVTPKNKNYVIIDPFERIWICTESKGLFQYNEKEDSLTNYLYDKIDLNSISDNTNYSMCIDRSGILWIGTFSQGLCKYNLYKKPFIHFKSIPNDDNSLSGNVISSIHSTKPDELWVGVHWDGGVNRFVFHDNKQPQVIHYKHNAKDPNTIGSDGTICLMQRKNGEVWVGSTGGVVSKIVPEKPGKNSHPAIKVYEHLPWTFSIHEDDQGALWGGTWLGGIWRHDDSTDKFIRYKKDPNNPFSLCDNICWTIGEDNCGNIWLGGHDEGFSILPAKDKSKLTPYFINFKHEEENIKSLSNNTVQVFFQDHTGTMWIGTNGGLNKVIKKDGSFRNIKTNDKLEFISYHIKDGLPSESIVGILEDNNGNLWLSTSNGLSKFNILKETFTNYDETDGLQSNEFWYNAYFKDQKGRLYFGGQNGFNAFYPDSIQKNQFNPQIAFTDLKIFNKSININEKINGDIIISNSISKTSNITLSFKNNVFSLEFAALHYTRPEKNQYAYMMEGFETSWNYVGKKREATYTNLNPGQYTFKVKASNNDGIWNEKGISIKIIILPPWWATWWFKLIIGIFIIAGFIFITIRIINKIKQSANQTILNERNQLQTLINNLPDRVIIKDTKSRFIIVNKATINYFGVKRDSELTYRTDYELYPKELADTFFRQELEILTTGIPLINEESTRIINGQETFLSATKCPIISTKGETIGLVCIIRDITEQKKAELELKKFNTTLSESNTLLEERQQQIEEQSEELRSHSENLKEVNDLLLEKQQLIQLQSDKLLDTNRELYLLNSTKDRFFSIIAHDLRNPFNAVTGFSEILLRDYEKLPREKIEKYLTLINKSSVNGNVLLENLLQWSRAQTGTISFEPKILNLQEIADDVLSILEAQAQQKNIQIIQAFETEIMVNADENMLKTILRNLVSNAIKYTDEKGAITLKAIENSSVVEISVTDTGVGISPDNLELLFNVETNISTKGTASESGTGLGLILCKEFVEKNGGKIWVVSRLNKGSEFKFTLPTMTI